MTHDDAMMRGWPRRADARYAIISQWTGRGRGGDAKERRPVPASGHSF